MKYLCNIFIIVLLLPNCGAHKKLSSTLQHINTWSEQNIQTSIYQTPLSAAMVEENLHNLSREKAIEISLRNNQDFLAQLEDIGIKSGDLVQAGFFSNPTIETIFLFPHPAEQTNIAINATMVLSDFWQVPLRKKIAEDELMIKTSEILESILKLRKDVYITFHRCIFEKLRYSLLQKTIQALQALKQHIEYRYTFGYTSDLDIYMATTELYTHQAQLTKQYGMLSNAFYDLQYLLGLNQPDICITIDRMIALPHLSLSADELFSIAQQHHPTLTLHKITMQKAQTTIYYEQSRVIDNVQAGISYNRDFDKHTAGVGPYLAFDLPVFNTNYGNIEHARHELKKATYSFENNISIVQNKINSLYTRYTTLLKTIEWYPKHIFPSLRKAIEYAQQQMEIMQLPATTVIDTQLKYLQAGQEFIDYLEEASNIYAKLERAVGKSLLS